MKRAIPIALTSAALLAAAPASAQALGSPTPGHWNNWAAHNVIVSNFGGFCGKRLSRICLVDRNYAHCGPVMAGTDGERRCYGTYNEYAPAVLYTCKWRGAIFRANPKRVLTILPVGPCRQGPRL